MKLTLNGAEYRTPLFDLLDVGIGEAREIKRNTGMTISDWRLGLLTIERQDPDVLAAIVYLLRHRAGEQVDWDEINGLSTMQLARTVTVEDGDLELPDEFKQADEPAPEPEPEPEPETPPAESSPKKAPVKRAPKSKAAAAS